jgi:hypothetical protein
MPVLLVIYLAYTSTLKMEAVNVSLFDPEDGSGTFLRNVGKLM